jgi:Ankyrin repeats (many copies)
VPKLNLHLYLSNQSISYSINFAADRCTQETKVTMTGVFSMCPDSVVLYISTYLGPIDWSSLGNLCVSFARERKELWAEIFVWKFVVVNACSSRKSKGQNLNSGIMKKSRATRSESNPRLAFFNALRNRMYAFDNCAMLMTAALRKADSLRAMTSIMLPDFPVNRLFIPFSDSTLLCTAVRFRRWRVVKYIITELGANMNMQDQNGMNPLLIAAWWGDFYGVKKLFEISQFMLQKYEWPPEVDPTTAKDLNPSLTADPLKLKAVSPVKTGRKSRNLFQKSPAAGNNEHCQVTGLWKSFIVDLDLVGSPSMTSVCGGSGPYNAEEWARRKSTVCPDRKEFADIFKFLQSERARRSMTWKGL